jgi:hypothetical protein
MNRGSFLWPVTLLFAGCESGGTKSSPLQLKGSDGSHLSEGRLKACRAEVPSHVKAIKNAEEVYDAETDAFLPVTAHPSQLSSGKNAVSWNGGNSGFNNLYWKPSGDVRGVYSVSTTASSSRTPGGDFKITGRIDCDGDGVEATYTATKSINVTRTTPEDVF